jgi:hypothetical protein
MNRRPPSLRVEEMERRDVPASFGNPWADPTHLTASFAPDGTSVQTEISALSTVLGGLGSSAAGQQEILRAIQTWVSAANVNVGLVGDGGQAFGTAGSIQGDDRFGDIRFGSVTTKDSILAHSQPFDVVAGTYSGDILLNDAASFSKGGGNGSYDLYTVALQEIGHALGLANSTNLGSVMYDDYRVARSGLSADDIGRLRSLYGARQPDQYDKKGPNDTFAKATSLSLLSTLLGTVLGTIVDGDITTASDVDHYRFTSGLPGWMTISLKTSGISLLTSRLEVYDSAGNRLSTSVSNDPLTGDLTCRINVGLLKNYTIRVAATDGSFFDVGAYQLRIAPDGVQLALDRLGPLPEPVAGLNDSLLTASLLPLTGQLVGTDARYDYAFREAIVSTRDVDYYRFTVPNDVNASMVLNASVWNLENTSFRPKVTLYDSGGRPIVAEIVLNEAGSYSIQAGEKWRAGQAYFVKVESADGSGPAQTGRYFLGLDFNDNVAALQTVQGPTALTSAVPTEEAWASTTEAQFLHLALSVEQAPAHVGVELSIYDSAGALVWTLTAFGGDTRTGTIWLRGDSYRFVYRGVTGDGSPFQGATFTLKLKGLSDSIDPYPTDSGAGTTSTGTGVTAPTRDQQSVAWYYYAPPPSTRTYQY